VTVYVTLFAYPGGSSWGIAIHPHASKPEPSKPSFTAGRLVPRNINATGAAKSRVQDADV